MTAFPHWSHCWAVLPMFRLLPVLLPLSFAASLLCRFRRRAVMTEIEKGPGSTPGPDVFEQSERSRFRSAACFIRSSGTGSIHFGFRLAAIEFAHDIRTNRPRCNLHGFRLPAFAVRLLVGRADEAAFNEDVSALLDDCSDMLCESRTEHTDAVPLGFRGPFVLRVFPGALGSDRKNGELRTVVTRLTPLRVGANKSDERD